MSAPRASRHPFPTPVASPSDTTPLTLEEQTFYSLTMPTALHRAISRFRPTRRPAGRDGATAARCSAAAFRAAAEQRLQVLERDVGDLKGRLNGLIFLVTGTVIAQLILKLVQ